VEVVVPKFEIARRNFTQGTEENSAKPPIRIDRDQLEFPLEPTSSVGEHTSPSTMKMEAVCSPKRWYPPIILHNSVSSKY